MKGSVERNIVANLGRRYRWALDAFETSRKILKGVKNEF